MFTKLRSVDKVIRKSGTSLNKIYATIYYDCYADYHSSEVAKLVNIRRVRSLINQAKLKLESLRLRYNRLFGKLGNTCFLDNKETVQKLMDDCFNVKCEIDSLTFNLEHYNNLIEYLEYLPSSREEALIFYAD